MKRTKSTHKTFFWRRRYPSDSDVSVTSCKSHSENNSKNRRSLRSFANFCAHPRNALPHQELFEELDGREELKIGVFLFGKAVALVLRQEVPDRSLLAAD